MSADIEIWEYLHTYFNGDENGKLTNLMMMCVGRVFKKECINDTWRLSGGGVFSFIEMAHIADWLKAAVLNNEPWLQNVDSLGRPKKLMKFGTIAQIVQEADKQMLKTAQRLGSVKLVDGDEELYETLDDGYSIVRLLTPASLDKESAQMQHCIGGGAYDDALECEKHLYLSLRDNHGKPHATMEIAYGGIEQLQGKQNQTLAQKYLDRLIPFFKRHSFSPDRNPLFGYVVDENNDWYPLDKLPDDLTIYGSLSLMMYDIARLPDGLTVTSHLFLEYSSITELPARLTVGGDLDVSGTAITHLRSDTVVNGRVFGIDGTEGVRRVAA